MEYHYEYGMNFGQEQIMEFLEDFGPMIIGVVIAFALVAMLWAVAVYVLKGLGLYTVARRRQIQNPWLAWIPVADAWILGCVSDQYQYVSRGRVTNRRKILLGLSVAGFAVSFVVNIISNTILMTGSGSDGALGAAAAVSTLASLVSAVLSIVNLVFTQIALYDYYASASPDNKVLFLVLGIFLGFLQPFFIFFNRKSDAGMPPRRQEPRYEAPVDAVYETPEEPVRQAPVDPVYESPSAAQDPWDRPDNE